METRRSNFLQVTLSLSLAWYTVTTWRDERGDKVSAHLTWEGEGASGAEGPRESGGPRRCGFPFLTDKVPCPFP